MILKGQPAYKYRAGKLETNSLQSITRSHRCWFIINIWKSDHRMNVTLGTDIKFTLCFLPAKSLCCWRWIFLSYFKTQKLWSEDNLNTNGRGLSSDVDKTVLSVSHISVTSVFQGQPLLSNSCWMCLSDHDFCPSKPHPFAQPDWRECACANFHNSKGTGALRQVHINPDLIFALHWLPLNVRIKYN